MCKLESALRDVTFEDGLTSYDGAGGEAAADERWEGGFDPSHSLRGWVEREESIMHT